MAICVKVLMFLLLLNIPWLYQITTLISFADAGVFNNVIKSKYSLLNQVGIKDKAFILNEYKIFMRENIQTFDKYPLVNFHNFIDNSENVRSFYDVHSFLDEFKGLEKQFHKLNEDILPFYHSLLTRIKDFSETDSENKKLLSFLYTAILSKIYFINSSSKSDLIIDMSAYLSPVKQDIARLNLLQSEIIILDNNFKIAQRENERIKEKIDVINKYKQSYQMITNQKIQEAQNLISNEIMPVLDEIEKEIDKQIELLIKETIKMQNDVKHEKEELKKLKEKLEEEMRKRAMFGFFKLIAAVLGCFGPYGKIAGSIVDAGTSIAESLTLSSGSGSPPITTLPSVVTNEIQIFKSNVKLITSQETDNLNELATDISGKILGHGRLQDVELTIQDLQNKINSGQSTPEEIKAIKNKLKEKLSGVEETLKAEKIDPNHKDAKALAIIPHIKQGMEVFDASFDIYKQYKNDKEKIAAVQAAIAQADIKLQKLKEYEENIRNWMAPMLNGMMADLTYVANNLNGKSPATLDVMKWKVQGALRDMKLQMQQFTRGFAVQENLSRNIEQLEEGMTTLIVVYDRIQSYQEQQNLVNFIADVSTPIARNWTIPDPTLVITVMNLELEIRSNLVLQRYKSVVGAFKQWVFPFADYFLKSLHDFDDSESLESLVPKVIVQIENIERRLSDYKSMITEHDKVLFSGYFDSHHVSSRPFFVWENEKHKNAIEKLLSGEKIVVKADVLDTSSSKEAIKFNLIDFNFNSRDSSKQSQIDEKLKGFKITAKHLGNSYYKFEGKVYVITTESQTIEFTFEKFSGIDMPVYSNKVYEKIKSGNLMLSPYAMWEIKLTKVSQNASFSELLDFKTEVDFELAGRGSFVDANENNFLFNAEQYYKHEIV